MSSINEVSNKEKVSPYSHYYKNGSNNMSIYAEINNNGATLNSNESPPSYMPAPSQFNQSEAYGNGLHVNKHASVLYPVIYQQNFDTSNFVRDYFIWSRINVVASFLFSWAV